MPTKLTTHRPQRRPGPILGSTSTATQSLGSLRRPSTPLSAKRSPVPGQPALAPTSRPRTRRRVLRSQGFWVHVLTHPARQAPADSPPDSPLRSRSGTLHVNPNRNARCSRRDEVRRNPPEAPRCQARVPTTTRYSCSKRASSSVPRFHSSQKRSSASSRSPSRPSRLALLRAAIVGPYLALKCSP